MFWLLKKLFSLGIFAALVFFALQFKVGGKPLKDYVIAFYQAPLTQEILRQGEGIVRGYLEKDVHRGKDSPAPVEDIQDEERDELKRVIEKKAR